MTDPKTDDLAERLEAALAERERVRDILPSDVKTHCSLGADRALTRVVLEAAPRLLAVLLAVLLADERARERERCAGICLDYAASPGLTLDQRQIADFLGNVIRTGTPDAP